MKIKKQTISDNISRYLRDQIMTQQLKAGDRIVESQIAKKLGVSQAPVREALLQLEGMGFVENKPYVGSYVLPFNMEIINQAFELRYILESYAAGYAIEKMEEEDICRMEGHLKNMREALKEGNRLTIINEDNNLHAEMVKSVGNPMLIKMWQMSALQWANLTISYYDDMEYIVHSHVKLIELLREKDIDELRKELKTHFENARSITQSAFSKIHN